MGMGGRMRMRDCLCMLRTRFFIIFHKTILILKWFCGIAEVRIQYVMVEVVFDHGYEYSNIKSTPATPVSEQDLGCTFAV